MASGRNVVFYVAKGAKPVLATSMILVKKQ
jgi:hypothetical protein